MVPLTLEAIFDELELPRSGVLYVQSSTDWLAKAGFSAAETLSGLLDWTREGTLVMPAYPFRTTHREYLDSAPRFDVRKTAVAIGLIPEVFRRTAGVKRSLDPDFSIAALGADSADVVRTAPGDEDPFSSSSVYARLIERGARLVGLGVSLNTNSFIHVVDSRLSPGYPRPAYDGRFPVDVVDDSGAASVVWRQSLHPDFQRLTRPSAVIAASDDPQMYRCRMIDGVNFFQCDLPRWSSWCESHGRAAAASGQWPCWLSRLGDHTSA